MNLLTSIIQLILVPIISPFVVGLIRKIKAKLQNRQGASVFQPYLDIWKLLHKDEVVSRDASWIFKFAPFVIFATTLVIGASIPLFASFLSNNFTSDLLVVVYTLAIGTFFLALSGMDTGGPFGGFGASREMTLAALAEGGLIFSMLTVAIINHTTNLFTISNNNLFYQGQYFIPTSLAFAGFFIVLLAENTRFPFDNPSTHLELTMVHEAMILEHSGKKLALLEWASANKLVIFVALATNLFFPIGLATTTGAFAIIIGLLALLAKLIIFSIIIALIESVMAKFRFFRLPDLLIISFILNAVAIALIR